jgi:hypothetical protein
MHRRPSSLGTSRYRLSLCKETPSQDHQLVTPVHLDGGGYHSEWELDLLRGIARRNQDRMSFPKRRAMRRSAPPGLQLPRVEESALSLTPCGGAWPVR